MIGFEKLGELLEKVAVRGIVLEDVERDDHDEQWRATIALHDRLGGTPEYTFYFEETAVDDEGTSTVSVGCVMAVEPELWDDAEALQSVLLALNDANAEPGVKYRLVRVDERMGEVVCEGDLPDQLVTSDAISLLLDRVADGVEARADVVDAAVG